MGLITIIKLVLGFEEDDLDLSNKVKQEFLGFMSILGILLGCFLMQ
jgi:hypothetical protein